MTWLNWVEKGFSNPCQSVPIQFNLELVQRNEDWKLLDWSGPLKLKPLDGNGWRWIGNNSQPIGFNPAQSQLFRMNPKWRLEMSLTGADGLKILESVSIHFNLVQSISIQSIPAVFKLGRVKDPPILPYPFQSKLKQGFGFRSGSKPSDLHRFKY